MAGGQHRRNARPSTADFVRELNRSRQQAQPRRFCWVAGPPEDPGPWPGLLVAWERRPDGWWGRVVYVAGDAGDAGDADDVVVVEAWMPARQLRAHS